MSGRGWTIVGAALLMSAALGAPAAYGHGTAGSSAVHTFLALLTGPPNGFESGTPAIEARAPEGRREAHDDRDDDDHRDADDHGAAGDHGGGHGSRLSDEYVPLQLEGFPQRPKPIIELGPHFLGTGNIGDGFVLPTGAVWTPQFLAFGTLRTAGQVFDRGGDQTSELVARLDLFGNLQLSGSERLVIGFRNFDQEGRFTRYVVSSDRPGVEEGFEDELNSEIQTLFFEGDFGEIFPRLSKRDFAATDWGFSVGRQPLSFQEGVMINDALDGIGITRNTLLPNGTSNFRVTFFYAWDDIHRTDRSAGRANREDRSAQLFAVLTSTDVRKSTIDVDAAWVSSDFGDLGNIGITSVQRFGKTNSSFHLLSSFASGEDSALAADGTLAFAELSWIPHGTHDLLYANSFVAFDDYTSVARDPATGGPLGRVGINFAAVGIGSFGAPLSNQAREVAGGALGYQRFWNHTRTQMIFELGARFGLEDAVADEAAFTTRFQQALGRRFVVVLDGFVGYRDAVVPGASEDTLWGGRMELVTKF